MFSNFLIHTCTIEEKTLVQESYEQTEEWAVRAASVACRKDSDNSAKITDGLIRMNTDDDLFFFNPDVEIDRGNRILLDGDYYDVIKINKLYGATSLHHLEVIARLTDHK